MFKIVIKISVLFIIFFLTFATKIVTADFKSNPDFQLLENKLRSIKFAQGYFTQNVEGTKIKAQFFLKLPAKLKIDYLSSKLPITVIVTPTVLTYYDKKLDQKSQVKTPNNASSLILTPSLSLLNKKIKILSLKSGSNKIEVEFSHSDLPNNIIKAFFSRHEGLTLIKIEMKGPAEKSEIEFNDVIINNEISDKEFQILNKKIDAKFNF